LSKTLQSFLRDFFLEAFSFTSFSRGLQRHLREANKRSEREEQEEEQEKEEEEEAAAEAAEAAAAAAAAATSIVNPCRGWSTPSQRSQSTAKQNASENLT
jgi:hypothetical protein